MTEAEAMKALRDLVGVFIWYPADDASRELPVRPVEEIDLSDSGLTDEGVAYLRCFSKLEWLDLSNNPLTDAGLTHLAMLSKLQRLDLTHTNVTSESVAKLHRALPNCKIDV
jgi:hypothetical protein